jgi:predicted transcriptional regulator YdeE
MMEPTRIIERPRLVLAGFSFYGDPFAFSDGWSMENEIGRLWQRFLAFFEDHSHHISGVVDAEAMFEVHVEHPETPEKGEFEVFVGVEVDDLTTLPVQLVVKILPPTHYAIFTLRGEEITSDWGRRIYEEWLPSSPYDVVLPYGFQYYDDRFKGLDHVEDSLLDVYVPVVLQK